MLKKKARFDYFHSNNVSWRGRPIRLQRVLWHSCSMYGWDKIEKYGAPNEFYTFFVFTIRYKTRGWAFYYFPYKHTSSFLKTKDHDERRPNNERILAQLEHSKGDLRG